METILRRHRTQQEIADEFGVSKSVIERLKNDMSVKIVSMTKMTDEELINQDLDFLIDYKNFEPFNM